MKKNNKKEIALFYVNRIKELDYKIFLYADDDFPNRRAIAICNCKVDMWLDKAGITDRGLRREVLSCINWYDNNCVSKLLALGWKVSLGVGGDQ